MSKKGLFYRLKRLASVKGEKAIKKHEDSVEIFEYELGKSKESMQKVSENISTLKSKKQVAANHLAETKNRVTEIQEALDLSIEQGDDETGQELFIMLENKKKELEYAEQNASVYDTAIQKSEEQYQVLKNEFALKNSQLDQLRAKNELQKNLREVNEELKKNYVGSDFDGGVFSEIQKELDEKVYFETDQNEQLGARTSIESKLTKVSSDSAYEQYKAGLKQDSGSSEE